MLFLVAWKLLCPKIFRVTLNWPGGLLGKELEFANSIYSDMSNWRAVMEKKR